MILLRFSRPVVTARVAIWPKTSTRTENVVETTTWRPLVDPRNSSTLGFYGWLLMMVYKWWYIHYGLVTFFCHALVGEIATALARWDHDPWRPAAGTLFSAAKTVIASFADVDVCIPCSISHYSFIYTSLYIYTNLYQFIYQSISYIYVLHGFYIAVVLPVQADWLISNTLAFFGRLFGLRHRYGCAKSVKIIWHGQADSHRACVTMYLGMSQVRNKLWTRSHVVSRYVKDMLRMF